ncbi:MAG: metallophosphoesterase [Nanoarchaeota archaeon]
MKILALSDVHGDVSFMKEMAEKGASGQVDLVVIAGDILGSETHKEGLVQPFKEKGLEVAIVPGNHEGMATINFMVERYKARNLHGYSLKIGDVGLFGCGYGDIGIHQLDEKDFFTTLKKAHDSLQKVKKKVMVTHVQPSESILSLKVSGWGSSGVRKAIEELKPDVHICGHVHETHGIEEVIGKTRVINVGRTGRIIEI